VSAIVEVETLGRLSELGFPIAVWGEERKRVARNVGGYLCRRVIVRDDENREWAA